MLSLPASKGFDIGSGFGGVTMTGMEHNDAFRARRGKVFTTTNFSGGIQGGISNGEAIDFRVAFKPVATVMHEQDTVDVDFHNTTLKGRGRHDPCVLPRAVFSGLADWSRGADPQGLRRAGAYVAVLAVTAAGYLRGRRLAQGSGSLLAGSPPVPNGRPPWREAT